MRVRFKGVCDQAVSIFIVIIFITLFPGCRRSAEELPVVPPATPPLTRNYIGYAVVNVSFTHLLNEPGGVSQAYIRRGTVVRILERRINAKNSETWVLAEGNYQGEGGDISKGWLQEATVDVFDNESKAITASKSMTL